jgi:hypothetical protein
MLKVGVYGTFISGLQHCVDASNQTLQEVVELKDLVGSSRDIGPLGKGVCVGSIGCDAHAIGIQRIEI